MATSMSKSTTGAKTAGPSKQYLKKGGKVKTKLAKKDQGGQQQRPVNAGNTNSIKAYLSNKVKGKI